MALPNTNISTSLVGTTIGSGSRDVGTLCTHPNINKWSKWKPVRFNKVTGLVTADFQAANFGLTPAPSSDTYTDVIGAKWEYARPRGGANEPYRLGDFRNYFDVAPPIMTVPENVEFNRTTISTYKYTAAINRSGNDYFIGIDDFIGALGNLYFGVVVTGAGPAHIVTSVENLTDGGNEIIFNTNQAPFNNSGSLTLYNVLVDTSFPNSTPLSFAGPVVYTSIPSGDSGTDITSLSITTGAGLQTIVRRISNNLSGPYMDIAYYIGRDGDIFVTSGAVYFEIDLITGNNGATVQQSLYTIRANPTYFGANSIDHASEMYDGTTPIASMSVPANSTRVIRLGRSNLVNMDGSSPSAPQPGFDEANSLIDIKYGGILSWNGGIHFRAY